MTKETEKKKIIDIIILAVFLIFIIIIILLTGLYYQKNNELNVNNNNILYYSESKEEENKLIIVEVDEKNTQIGESTNGEYNLPYYIKVNNEANVVTIYKKDGNGEFTVPVKAMLCSIGEATPEGGVYETSDKYDWGLMQGNVWAQYAYRITGHILFHSVPYTARNKGTLEWWEYDKLGTSASLGCVRLTVEDAKWIYENCEVGTKVEFYSDENPGPLGIPKTRKISNNEDFRNWDPTDPDTKNPWKEYLQNQI